MQPTAPAPPAAAPPATPASLQVAPTGARSGPVPTPRPPRKFWPELDVVRGLAAVLMVWSHTGAELMRLPLTAYDNPAAVPWSSPLMLLVWLGGAAPVLFFFLTGVGQGVKGPAPGAFDADRFRGWGVMLVKVGVLLAADAMLWLPQGGFRGLDFFGFIGLSVLLLWVVHRLPGAASWITAAALAAAAIGARYVLVDAASALGLLTDPASQAAWRAGVGDEAVPGRSYPLGPWLAVPMLGYLTGRLLAWREPGASASTGRNGLVALLLGVGAAGLAAAAVLVLLGKPLGRWGNVSPSFFGFGIGGTALLLGGLLWIGGGSGMRRWGWLKLRGIAAFVVVPLHYAVLAVAWGAFGVDLAPVGGSIGEAAAGWAWLLGLPLVCLAAAPWLERGIQASAARLNAWQAGGAPGAWARVAAAWGTVAGVVAVVGVVIFDAGGDDWAARALGAGAQLMLCGLLVWPAPVTLGRPRTR